MSEADIPRPAAPLRADAATAGAAAHPAPTAHAASAQACANCDEPFDTPAAPPRYCPHCGQATTLHPPSVAEFAHEFVGHYVALEGPLWKTLGLLLFRPGRLTSEYLHGRRRRYVPPLRLYLSASFVFFVAFKLYVPGPPDASEGLQATPSVGAPSSTVASGVAPAIAGTAGTGAARSPAASAAPSETGHEEYRAVFVTSDGIRVASGAAAAALLRGSLSEDCAHDAGHPCGWFERKAHAASRRWAASPGAAQASLATHWMGVAPYAVFLMQPVFAALLALAYRRRHMFFGEHLVFSMHVHAFWFLAALVAVFVPLVVKPWLFLVALGYLLLALHEAYSGGWPGTVARGGVIAAIYGASISVVSLCIVTALFLM
jgi:hypothetical protein